MLCAPAVIAMLLVTAYPILYAIVLSLQNLDLRFPDETSLAGLSQLQDRPHLGAVVAGRLQHRVHRGRSRSRSS